MMSADDLNNLRTVWALERTQLAWVRTAFAVITAGIALEKGATALHRAKLLENGGWVEGGHIGGVTLAVLASVQLAVATVAYVRRFRTLAHARGERPPWLPDALPISLLVIFAGVVVACLLLVWK